MRETGRIALTHDAVHTPSRPVTCELNIIAPLGIKLPREYIFDSRRPDRRLANCCPSYESAVCGREPASTEGLPLVGLFTRKPSIGETSRDRLDLMLNRRVKEVKGSGGLPILLYVRSTTAKPAVVNRRSPEHQILQYCLRLPHC